MTSKRKRPVARGGYPTEPVCGWCGTDIPLTEYHRAIEPDLPLGAFRAVCGEGCPERPPGSHILEQAGPRW